MTFVEVPMPVIEELQHHTAIALTGFKALLRIAAFLAIYSVAVTAALIYVLV